MNRIFNTLTNNKIYFYLTSILSVFIGLINNTNKLVICAFIYVCIIVSANIICELYGKKKAALSLIFSLLINLILFWNMKHYIHGIKFEIITVGSLVSLLVSTYCGIGIISGLKNSYNFQIRNFISLIICSLIDCSVMATVLSSKFPINKVATIFAKDMMIKSIYAITASLLIYSIIYSLKQIGVMKHKI